MIDIMNWQFEKKNYQPTTVGIGLDYGRALMLKAGYRGSEINNVLWMGEVVNYASALCSYGNRTYNDREIMVSEMVYNNLNEHNQDLLIWNPSRYCYHGYVVNTEMNEWLEKQKVQ